MFIVQEETAFQNIYMFLSELKYGHRFRRGPKPKMTVLAKASGNLPNPTRFLRQKKKSGHESRGTRNKK
jgi:hypothetical protein